MDTIETNKEIRGDKSNRGRVWLFRLLVIIGILIFLAAWFLPWWNMDVEGFGRNLVQIRPWGLAVAEKMEQFKVLMKGAEMPNWFPAFMWAYLGLCMIALLIGMFISGKKLSIGKLKFSLSQLLVGGVGFSYIFAGAFAAVYAGTRMKNTFGVALQGRTHIDFGDPLTAYVNTSMELGWYLVFAAGLLLILVAIFRDKIVGEQQSST
jgi:hypothetical protein